MIWIVICDRSCLCCCNFYPSTSGNETCVHENEIYPFVTEIVFGSAKETSYLAFDHIHPFVAGNTSLVVRTVFPSTECVIPGVLVLLPIYYYTVRHQTVDQGNYFVSMGNVIVCVLLLLLLLLVAYGTGETSTHGGRYYCYFLYYPDFLFCLLFHPITSDHFFSSPAQGLVIAWDYGYDYDVHHHHPLAEKRSSSGLLMMMMIFYSHYLPPPLVNSHYGPWTSSYYYYSLENSLFLQTWIWWQQRVRYFLVEQVIGTGMERSGQLSTSVVHPYCSAGHYWGCWQRRVHEESFRWIVGKPSAGGYRILTLTRAVYYGYCSWENGISIDEDYSPFLGCSIDGCVKVIDPWTYVEVIVVREIVSNLVQYYPAISILTSISISLVIGNEIVKLLLGYCDCDALSSHLVCY